MKLEKNEIKDKIKAKMAEIVASTGGDASQLQDDELIPATGLIDSSGLLELVAWYESHFDMPLKQEEINIDNLGSIEAMADYLLLRKSG